MGASSKNHQEPPAERHNPPNQKAHVLHALQPPLLTFKTPPSGPQSGARTTPRKAHARTHAHARHFLSRHNLRPPEHETYIAQPTRHGNTHSPPPTHSYTTAVYKRRARTPRCGWPPSLGFAESSPSWPRPDPPTTGLSGRVPQEGCLGLHAYRVRPEIAC